jgi:hypothetical protein
MATNFDPKAIFWRKHSLSRQMAAAKTVICALKPACRQLEKLCRKWK